MDVGPPFVAHLEAAEAIEPRERAFHHPAIASEPLARFDAAPGNAGNDAPGPQRPSTPWVVVALVGVELRRALARSASLPMWEPQRRDGVDRFLQQPRIMHVSPGDGHRQRQAHTVDHEVPLRAQLAAIRRILAGRFAPPGAGTLALSTDARSQSICPAVCSRCKST